MFHFMRGAVKKNLYNGTARVTTSILDWTISKEVNGVSAQFDVSTWGQRRHVSLVVDSEAVMLSEFLGAVDSSTTVWDVGAAEGVYGSFAAALGANVVAFEPFDGRRAVLQQNLNLNGGDAVVSRYALGDSNTTADFHIDAGDVSGTTKQVEVRRGDYLISDEGFRPPDVLKLDIEGGELVALKGLEETLEDVTAVFCEVHPEEIVSNVKNIERGSVSDVRELLEGAGFDVETIDSRTIQPFIAATR